jgi:small-conductance mechanosensitive channel
MKIYAGYSERLGDNERNMARAFRTSAFRDSFRTTTVTARRHWFLRAASLTLLLTLTGASARSAQQAGSLITAPKPSSNPLTSLLPDKPKVPVAEQELAATLAEQPVPIPLPDVAARSLVLAQTLRDAAAKLPTNEQVQSIQTAVSQLEPDLQSKQEQTKILLSGTPNSLEVREEENFWRGVQSYTKDWQRQLLDWANNAQKAIQMLDKEEPTWAATLEANKDNRELGPALAVISGNLNEIHKLRQHEQQTLQALVNLQIKVGEVDQTAQDAISQLVEVKAKLKGHLLDRDSLPLWQVRSRRVVGETTSVFHTVNSRWISIISFLRENRGILVFLFFLFIACEVLAKKLHDIVRTKQPTDEVEVDAYRILRRWFAVGLLPPLAVGYLLAPGAPVTVLGLVILVSFVPILVVLPPLLHPRLRKLLYLFASIYGLNWLISWIGLSPASRRELQFITNAVLFFVLAYLVRPSRSLPSQAKWWGQLVLQGIRMGVVVLGVSLLADLFGYVKLAHALGLACIYSALVAISVLTAVRVATLLLTVGLRSPQAERIAAVRLHRQGITRWVPRAFQWTGIVIWCLAALDLLGLEDGVRSWLSSLFKIRIVGGSSGATLGGLFGFFVIILVGYGIANAIRFFFREEVLRRFHMSRGLPELIASVIYYLLMLIVVLAAVNAAGVELNKFTVLTGAFGVGIGFGLQNIINNFVSGLILQFERPIHIDDILEVDNNTGKVSRIGIRSSTIRTFQGAEVIIPNATLISSKVINWTLSESQRRRELPVGVAYGTDPKLVLKILRDAAARHELVLTKPEPMVYFTGFGESALNFELHFWVMQENNGLQITSEVALAAMQMFEDAGIEIPFPQRDLHLRSVDRSAAELLQASESHPLPPPDEREFEPLPQNLPRKRHSSAD